MVFMNNINNPNSENKIDREVLALTPITEYAILITPLSGALRPFTAP